MGKHWKHLAIMFLITPLIFESSSTVFAASDDENANARFAEATQLITSEQYEEGLKKLNSIRTDYPSSRIAADITQDKIFVNDMKIIDIEKKIALRKRFVDNGNGTITDKKAKLIVLKDASCFGRKDWNSATSAAQGLANGSCGLSDGSKPGDWRLPVEDELPYLSEWKDLNAFTGVQTFNYWSSTTHADKPSLAWYVNLSFGYVSSIGFSAKTGNFNVWPVRNGQ